jgi:hydrogenase nickel incorporation protein HypB
MCATCGCSGEAGPRIRRPDHTHPHEHAHPHEHGPRTVTVEQDLLAKNDLLARRAHQVHGQHVPLVQPGPVAPGAGKTTLLERTVRELGEGVSVIEGDQETLLDADRIKAAGAPVVQINTGAGCHLDADMLHRALGTLDPAAGSLLFVENVGNLVCPALFDLGEQHRVVLLSVTEGQDKPRKYPQMFTRADLVVVNKIDLLPYVDFGLPVFEHDVRTLNAQAEVLPLSATSGAGLGDWYRWLRDQRTRPAGAAIP